MALHESPCYLDNSATTRPFDEVIASMAASMADRWHNPSAAYGPGLAAQDAVQAARALVLASLGGMGAVVFTSGGTEADNLAVLGSAGQKRARFITTVVEHPAVAQAFEALRALGHDVVTLPVDSAGILRAEDLEQAVDGGTRLVSVMHVNNETGAVQDIAALAAIVKRKNPGTLFHSDGVQAYLRLPAEPGRSGIDLYSVSAHKVHGPKGAGALFVKDGVRLAATQFGGGQEGGLRSGTENTAGISGFAKAVEVYGTGLEDRRAALMRMKLALARELLAIGGSAVNGPAPETGAPHILNVSFEGVQGEVLLRALAEKGVYVSTGAACGSRRRKQSSTLSAMGLGRERIDGAVRFSLSVMNTMEDVARAADAARAEVTRLRAFKRR